MRTNAALTVGILADDLTSAADRAAPCVARGLRASIGRPRLPCCPVAILLVAMKAGGFGDERTLRRAVAQLRRTSTTSVQEKS
jgi:uncharacterized protein YgbK (DUF1537 family)